MLTLRQASHRLAIVRSYLWPHTATKYERTGFLPPEIWGDCGLRDGCEVGDQGRRVGVPVVGTDLEGVVATAYDGARDGRGALGGAHGVLLGGEGERDEVAEARLELRGGVVGDHQAVVDDDDPLGQRVGPDAKIEVDPAAREQQAQRVTILLHKPIGYVSGQAEDGYEPASVLVKADTHWGEDPAKIHWAPGHGRNLAPAGRLDIDSTGLLVLTQDGRIARHLIGEDSDVEKEYLVRVALEHGDAGQHPQHQLDPKAIALLNHGLELDGVQLKPAKVSWANEDQLRFVLREGRKRQIRRMCELVGLKVLALKRVRIGRIPLGQLPPGQWRYLAPWERF